MFKVRMYLQMREQSMTYLYWQGAGLLTAAFVALDDYQIFRSENMNEYKNYFSCLLILHTCNCSWQHNVGEKLIVSQLLTFEE